MGKFATEILEIKYDRIRAKDIAAAYHNLSEQQRIILETILKKYEIPFDGKLSHY